MNKSDRYLPNVSGVIHVGANKGQECRMYNLYNLDVLWIEPIPQLFKKLEKNIQQYPKQRAYQYLITDKNGKTYDFHVANNHGASSSIYEFGSNFHDIHPDIFYTKTLSLTSTTLTTFVQQEKIQLNKYDALVMDTQGSEFLVLKGAIELINNFTYIKSEVADFDLYEGSCTEKDIVDFLLPYGFKEILRRTHKTKFGCASDIVFQKF